jgi:hypothetical protein
MYECSTKILFKKLKKDECKYLVDATEDAKQCDASDVLSSDEASSESEQESLI